LLRDILEAIGHTPTSCGTSSRAICLTSSARSRNSWPTWVGGR